jgi:TonB family protein
MGKVVAGFLLCLGLLILLGAVVSRSDAPSSARSDSGESSTPAQAALQVSALRLAAAYEANEVAADNQYSGRTLQVFGNVDSIDKDFEGQIHVSLIGVNEFEPVRAAMREGNEAEASHLVKLQAVAVQCDKVERIVGDVMLDGCDFIQIPQSAPAPESPTPTAAEATTPVESAPQTPQTEELHQPVILRKAAFQLTPQAIQDGTTGVVRLSFNISTIGTPTDIRVEQPVGDGLDEEAERALQGFLFSPSPDEASANSVRYSLDFDFRPQQNQTDSGNPQP